MKTLSKITGVAISSVPVFLINQAIDFKFNAEKREISTPFPADLMRDVLDIWGFTDEMVTVQPVK